MSEDVFLDELRQAVRPVVEEGKMREVSSTASPLYLAARFANASAGIEFAVEWGELRPLVTLFELLDGDFVGLHDPVRSEDGRRLTFDADDLLNLRTPDPSPVGRRLRRKAPGEVARVMGLYAEALVAAGSDVLGGDFRVFAELDQVVSARVEASRRGG